VNEDVQLSAGKRTGLQALSDERGIIAALALDQRTALRKIFARASGISPDRVSTGQLVEFKELVSRALTPYASAILLDPEYGLAAAASRDARTGLLLAYEQSGYDHAVPGRSPRLLENCSVARLKSAGANAVKVLLYYSPFSSGQINAKKHEWVARVGAECVASDLAFFLELVSYHDDLDEKSVEFARIKPDSVTRSVEEFCHPRYAVDVLKVGVPVNMKFVESPSLAASQAVYLRSQALILFRRASDAATLPFIYLSEGVSNAMFVDALKLAAEAGSAFSGVLCGRAIWQGAVIAFVRGGRAALEDWLAGEGTRNIQAVNAQLSAAHPWFEKSLPASSHSA